MSGRIATQAEVRAAMAFLQYLHNHYNRSIDPANSYLIIAVVSWLYQESGGLKNVIGNNPFNIRVSPFAVGYRQTRTNGRFAIFASIEKGFEAAAYLLINGPNQYGYKVAINALALGGNRGATEFLIGLALSSWDSGRYGTKGQNPADARYNHLLRAYASFTGLQMPSSQPKPPPTKHPDPVLPAVLRPPAPPRQYPDGFEARRFYVQKHPRSRPVDGGSTAS